MTGVQTCALPIWTAIVGGGFGAGRGAEGVMIEVRGLTKRYRDRTALLDVSFSIGRGEVVGLLGPNGAGKTTTLRILTGFLPPSAGTVRLVALGVTLAILGNNGGGVVRRLPLLITPIAATAQRRSASQTGHPLG